MYRQVWIINISFLFSIKINIYIFAFANFKMGKIEHGK